jgi:hypothetical protein
LVESSPWNRITNCDIVIGPAISPWLNRDLFPSRNQKPTATRMKSPRARPFENQMRSKRFRRFNPEVHLDFASDL